MPERFLYIDCWNRLFIGWARRLLDRHGVDREAIEKACEFFIRVKVPAGEIQAQLELAALDAGGGDVAAARRRLSGLFKKYIPGQGALKNPMLSARILACQAWIHLEGRDPDLRKALSILQEAESFLIGHHLRDLEVQVRELKRRIHLSNPGNPDAPHVQLPTWQGDLTRLEVMGSFTDALAGLVQRLGEEFGAERVEPWRRHLREIEEKLRESRRALEGKKPLETDSLRADSILGRSKAIGNVKAMILKVAPTSLPVLIQGETGTGKELVARAIHGESARRSAPFIPVNCASLPEPILEAELFGYLQGAFSGAEKDHRGLLVEASGGSFFFDGLAEMPMSLQGKLLRVLDRGSIRPLGGSEEVKIDVRFLFSASRDLGALVKEGNFRNDLYFRLSALEIRMPPLRERLEDLPELVELFRSMTAGGDPAPRLRPEALHVLASYPWPGNVRELQNVVTRLVLMARQSINAAEARSVLGKSPEQGLFSPALLRSRPLDQLHQQLEKEYLSRLYFDRSGDLKAVAGFLGITLRALYERFRRLEINPRQLKKLLGEM